MKYINFKRYKFSTIAKNFNTLRYNFLKIFKFVDNKRYVLEKIYKYLDISRFNLAKITKSLDLRTYNLNRIKKIKFFSYKFLLLHLPASIIFFGLLYLIIPMFYSYDKSNIEKAICGNKNIVCSIRGKINYSFYPIPRIKIKNLIIRDPIKSEDILIEVDHVAIKLSFKNLLVKEKHKFKKLQLKNFKINFNLKNLKKYKNTFSGNVNLIPIVFTKGQIVFFDGKDYVATINDANLNLKFTHDSINSVLKGKFLDDNIYINLNSKNAEDKIFTDIILKMSNMNFLTKANFTNLEKDENITNGNILVKKGKNRATAIFDYKDKEFIINQSNLRNAFLDGKLTGKITFLPYFDFNLNLELNSLNFTRLYNYFLSLDEKQKKKLFRINNKINGKLNISSEKVHSRGDLVKSFESRIKFYNGNISIEQFLLSLGKLGATDILGAINNDKKFSNLKFESNIFVDNQKKFLSKFGIYNKKSISPHLFISGNFDLENIRASFYEIANDKKLNNEDINYIESEFNELMLSDGYEKLFHFLTFKEFIKSITNANN